MKPGLAADRLPIVLLAAQRLAAGNMLGPQPCYALRVRVAAGPALDRAGVAARLSAMAPGFGEEFLAVALPSDADADGGTVAALWAAATASGRPLALSVRRDAAVPGDRLVLVEEGETEPPPRAVFAELLALLGASGARPSAAADAWLDGHATLLARSSWSVLRPMLSARGLAWRRALPPLRLRVGAGIAGRGLRGSITPQAGAIAGVLAEDKIACVAALRRFGLPVPRQRAVDDVAAAVAAAHELGFPVVVKPRDASGGTGVSTGLDQPARVAAAFRRAARRGGPVLVETMLPGEDHRILVVAGKVVSVVRKDAASVVGDGRRTVADLRAAANAEPMRRGAARLLMPIARDATTDRLLARQGLGWGVVPTAGRRVALQEASNWERGGRTREMLAEAHADNLAAARQAVRLTGLDVGGVDFLSPDIRRSWREVGGGICEVNRGAGYLIHLSAEGGSAQPIDRVVDHWLAGAPAVPVTVVVGTSAADRIAGRIADRLRSAGLATGLATSTRLVAAGLPLAVDGAVASGRVTRIVDDPAVAAVVVAMPAAVLLHGGLGYGRCDTAILVEGRTPRLQAAGELLAGLGAHVRAMSADAADDDLAPVADRILALARSVGAHPKRKAP